MRYVQGVKDVIKANLYWSFHSDRFLSDEQKIRLLTTDMVKVSALPSDSCDTRPTLQRPLGSPDTPEADSRALQATTLFNCKTIAPGDLENRTMVY